MRYFKFQNRKVTFKKENNKEFESFMTTITLTKFSFKFQSIQPDFVHFQLLVNYADLKYKAHLALLGANLIYGINHIVAKGIMPDKIGPSAFVFLRISIAGLIFWGIKHFVKEKVAKKDFLLLMFGGLFGVATNMLLFFHGLNLTSPIDASIIMTTGPVMVFIFSYFMLKERITAIKMLGIGLGAFGALLLISYGERAGGTSSALGNLFVFINASSYAFYLVLTKPLMKKYKPLTVISWVFLFGFIWMFPFGITDALNTDYGAFTLSTYMTIAFVVFGTTVLTYLFNIYALSKVSPTVIGSYIYLQPVISFLLVSVYGMLFHVDKYANDIDFVKIISCIMVAAGVYLISQTNKKT